MKCFVLGCANSNKYCGELFFFSIPKDPDLQKIWLDAIGRNSSVMLLCQRICSDHFRKEDIVAYGNRCTLKEGVVPSLHLPNPASYPFTNDMRKNVKDFFFKHSIQPVPFEANTSKKAIPSTSKNHPYDTKAIPSTSKNYPDDAHVSKQILEKVVDTAEADIPVILPARLSCEPSTSAIVTKSSKLKRPYSRILEKSPNEDSASPSSATSSAKRRMVKAFHSYSKSPLHYVKEIKSLRKRINILKTKKDTTQRTSCRRKKAIQSLNEIVVDLRKRNALSTDAVTILESTFSGTPLALMKRMIYTNKLTAAGKKGIGISYPPELKSFAMTLQFYSAKAYRYVRQTFNISLPAPSTIRSWLSKVDCSPGFTKPAIEALKVKATTHKEKTGHPLLGSLMLDEMYVRKEITVDKQSKHIWGYVNIGTDINHTNEMDEASQVLVLMVVGVNDNFKIPIGYFFINKFNGQEKANLVRESLRQIHPTGVRILGLICDGPSAHLKMMTELGCNTNPENLKTHFLHPVDKTKIHAILDICHMLKLVRNNWSYSKIWIDESGNKLKWEYIEKLQAIQEEKGLNLGNKLKKKHLQFDKAIMKVNLAAQTLSTSVADALEFLCKDLELEEFKDVMPTVQFVKKINDLFDFMNSRNPFGRGMHTPMKPANEKYWRPIVTNTINYLRNLKTANGQYVYKTQRKTPILGFIVSTTSLLNIFDAECKEGKNLCYILTYKFSQDHLELFFNGVRSRNGPNNNPSCLQFFYTYRRMITHIDIKNNTGNCLILDDTKILSVNTQITDIHTIRNRDSDQNEMTKLEKQIEICLPSNFDEFTDNVVTYIAGFVVRSVKKKVTCLTCIDSLYSLGDEENTSFKLIYRKSRGGLLFPSISVTKICLKIEKKIQSALKIVGKLPPKDILITLLMKETQDFLLNCHIFPTLEEHIFDYAPYEINHKKRLIDLIISTYSGIRMHSIANKVNESVSGEKIRKKCAKLVLFKNQ